MTGGRNVTHYRQAGDQDVSTSTEQDLANPSPCLALVPGTFVALRVSAVLTASGGACIDSQRGRHRDRGSMATRQTPAAKVVALHAANTQSLLVVNAYRGEGGNRASGQAGSLGLGNSLRVHDCRLRSARLSHRPSYHVAVLVQVWSSGPVGTTI